jgi:biopolymer transport protein ExbD
VVQLGQRLCKAAAEDPTIGVNIRADENTPHHFVVAVFDEAKKCRLERLGILHR